MLFTFVCLATCLSASSQHVSQLHFTSVPGQPASSQDFYRNRFLVIDFWATWCGPCIAAMPHLLELEQHFSQDSTIVFATITNEPTSIVQRFLKRKSISLTKHPLMDTTRQTWKNFNIDAIPATLVFSPTGDLLFRGNPKDLNVEKLVAIMNGTYTASTINALPKTTKIAKKPHYYLQITDPDSAMLYPEYTTSNTGKSLSFDSKAINISECFVLLTGISPLRILSDDSLKIHRRFNCSAYLETPFIAHPEHTITNDTLTNALLSDLARCFHFTAEWVTLPHQTLQLELTNAALLQEAVTISTYGKASSYEENILSLINYSPEELIVELENTELLSFPVTTAINTEKKYDFLLDITNETTLTASLQTYGLQLRTGSEQAVKMLRVCFY